MFDQMLHFQFFSSSRHFLILHVYQTQRIVQRLITKKQPVVIVNDVLITELADNEKQKNNRSENQASAILIRATDTTKETESINIETATTGLRSIATKKFS